MFLCMRFLYYLCMQKNLFNRCRMLLLKKRNITFALLTLAMLYSCTPTSDDDLKQFEDFEKRQNVSFDVMITNEGKILTRSNSDYGQFSEEDAEARLDPNKPFGLMGIDAETSKILVNNEQVFEHAGVRTTTFDSHNWYNTDKVLFSAYYPYVNDVEFLSGNRTYMIPYSAEDTQAGPLVSRTVEKHVSYLDIIPLVFRHITNDIGFMVCDITYAPMLQGHIRLRELAAYNFATEGYYIDSIGNNGGRWVQRSICDKIELFEGNAKVGVGSENEMFVGSDQLVHERRNSSRFYAVPDEIKMGKQYVEVVFDVDEFEYNGQHFKELKNQVQKFPIYGVLPGNVCISGKQYTFHLGLDLSMLYQTIEFTASVADWSNTYNAVSDGVWGEYKIYEDNVYF